MSSTLRRLLCKCAVGTALIVTGVPVMQNQVVPFAQAQDGGHVLSVTGDVKGLEPGRPGRLVLTLHNPGPVAAPVRQVTTAVRTIAPGCSLSVETWTGALSVPPGGDVSRAVTVRVVGPRCAGVQWDLDYTVN